MPKSKNEKRIRSRVEKDKAKREKAQCGVRKSGWPKEEANI